MNSTQYIFGISEEKAPDFSSTVYLDWNVINNRPLTISSNKPRINCQGDIRAPIKVTGKPIVHSLCFQKSKAKITKHREDFSSSAKGKANLKLSGESYTNSIKRQHISNYYIDGLPNNTSIHRRTSTVGSKRGFGAKVVPLFPKLQVKMNVLPKREIRPCTGNPQRNILTGDKMVENLAERKIEGGLRIGTAQTRATGKGQRSFRISTPQSFDQKRPDSRYNKTTIYSKLEHGRTNSPEYRVPVLEMNYSEVKKQQVIPECWK